MRSCFTITTTSSPARWLSWASSWCAKCVGGYWRPVTAIDLADTDGNPATVADPNWTSLLATPPYPSRYNVVNSAVAHSGEQRDLASTGRKLEYSGQGPVGHTVMTTFARACPSPR